MAIEPTKEVHKQKGAKSEAPLTSAQRRAEIAAVLAQHGWDVILHQLSLVDLLPGPLKQKIRPTVSEEEGPEVEGLPLPSVLRSIMVELGPTFVKLGQVLSTRADLLPADYIAELKKLQENVPPVPWPDMEQVILSEWNERKRVEASLRGDETYAEATSVYDIFETFHTKPLAAGSLGQAYKATIREQHPVDGEVLTDVIVKLQRPGVGRIVEADFAVLRGFAKLLTERSKWGKVYNFVEMVDDFAIIIRNELDFTQEASNTETIGQSLLKNYPGDVQVPRIYWEYTSPKMLCQEFVKGENIATLFIDPNEERFDGGGGRFPILSQERKQLARNFTNIFLHQVFIDGFFHADPHPGNVMVRLDKDTGRMRVILIDFGMAGRVDPRSREILIDFLLAIIQFDAARATDRILEFGKAPSGLDRQQFTQDLDHLLRKGLGRPLKEVSVGQLLQEVLDLTLRFQVQMPATFMTLVRVLVTIEGICRQLDREYILVHAAEPFVMKTLQSQFVSQLTFRELIRIGVDLRNIAVRLPRQVDDLLSNINAGQIKTIHEHRNLDPLEKSMRMAGNRLAIGFLAGTSFLGGAMLADKAVGPSFWGLPILAWGFLVIGSIMGLWLVRSIMHSDTLA